MRQKSNRVEECVYINQKRKKKTFALTLGIDLVLKKAKALPAMTFFRFVVFLLFLTYMVAADKEACLRSIIEMKVGIYPDSSMMNLYSGKGMLASASLFLGLVMISLD